MPAYSHSEGDADWNDAQGPRSPLVQFHALRRLAKPRGFFVLVVADGEFSCERNHVSRHTGNFEESKAWLLTMKVFES